MSYRVQGDPYWLEHVRFAGRCARCKQLVKAGARAFYYPKGRAIYCDSPACGQECSREFEAAAFDEASTLGGY